MSILIYSNKKTILYFFGLPSHTNFCYTRRCQTYRVFTHDIYTISYRKDSITFLNWLITLRRKNQSHQQAKWSRRYLSLIKKVLLDLLSKVYACESRFIEYRFVAGRFASVSLDLNRFTLVRHQWARRRFLSTNLFSMAAETIEWSNRTDFVVKVKFLGAFVLISSRCLSTRW